MQNNTPAMRKWSDLQGLAAVTIDTGTKVGTIDDFYFDPQTNAVYALLIKTGLFARRALKSDAINAIGLDAVTFANENALIKENSDSQLEKMLSGHSLLAYRVLSEGGNVIGTVGNVLLDTTKPTELHIAAFELAGGLRAHISGHYPTFEAKQVTRYGQDVIVISDAVAQTLEQK
ncbi:MAG: PRC-barrel domain-containing protein [Chloroflexi bacterium]|nr:PRC-barrel domain-containing protein [Chloroflexota bacterium]